LSRYHYRCPLCLKTIGDMTAFNSTVDAHLRQTQVPLQAALGPHANSVSLILCNDCELRYGPQPTVRKCQERRKHC